MSRIEQEQEKQKADRFSRQLETAAGDRAALERFLAECDAGCPYGLREKARERLAALAKIDHAKRADEQGAREDHARYERARGNIQELNAYLSSCSRCAFSNQARNEIETLERSLKAGLEQARAAEADQRLDLPDRQRIQVALAAAGFDPGIADGTFGRRTREMIATWQKSIKETETGYLTPAQRSSFMASSKEVISRFDQSVLLTTSPGTAFFDSGKSVLGAAADANVQKAARAWKLADPIGVTDISVTGYISSKEPPELAMQRAIKVKEKLMALGVPPGRVTFPFPKKRFMVGGDGPGERRVEMVIVTRARMQDPIPSSPADDDVYSKTY